MGDVGEVVDEVAGATSGAGEQPARVVGLERESALVGHLEQEDAKGKLHERQEEPGRVLIRTGRHGAR